MTNKKQLNIFLLLGVILIFSTLLLTPAADAYGFGNAFAGRVALKLPCDCQGSTGYQVTIQGGQSSGTYLDPGTARSFRFFSLQQGRNALGKYTTGGSCLYTVPEGCADRGISKGTITMFGVSF